MAHAEGPPRAGWVWVMLPGSSPPVQSHPESECVVHDRSRVGRRGACVGVWGARHTIMRILQLLATWLRICDRIRVDRHARLTTRHQCSRCLATSRAARGRATSSGRQTALRRAVHFARIHARIVNLEM